jgi:hypothetical protein
LSHFIRSNRLRPDACCGTTSVAPRRDVSKCVPETLAITLRVKKTRRVVLPIFSFLLNACHPTPPSGSAIARDFMRTIFLPGSSFARNDKNDCQFLFR